MIAFFRQTERFKVERYKQLRNEPGRPWAWVTVGYFTAPSMKHARAMARDAIADKLCILRAIPVGIEFNPKKRRPNEHGVGEPISQ